MHLDADNIKKITHPILKKAGVKHSALFGSFARGENHKKSDVDILVDMPRGKTLFDFVGLQIELEKELKRKVDLVDYAAVKPLLRKHILKNQVRIL